MPTVTRTEKEVVERLLAKATRNEKGCLICHLHTGKKGYISICIGGRQGYWARAHRFIYEQLIEPLLPNELVLHSCHVRNCIEPNHLYKGTAQDNTDDMMFAGRNRNQNSVKEYGYVSKF